MHMYRYTCVKCEILKIYRKKVATKYCSRNYSDVILMVNIFKNKHSPKQQINST